MRSPKKRLETKWRVFLSIIVAIIGGLLFLAPDELYDQITGFLIWPPILVIGVALTGSVYISRRYRAWGFELRDDYLYIQQGVFKKVKTMAPYVRIQHVDTQRDAIDRLFGISKVVIYTAGSRGADITVPGLMPEDADEMQQELRDVAIDSEDSDAV